MQAAFSLRTWAVCCLTLAAAVLPAGADPRAAAPEPEVLTAQDVLDRVARTYAACESYRDSGVVTTWFTSGGDKRLRMQPFKTAFIRPDRFRFEYGDTQLGEGRRIIWRDGADVQTWRDLKPDVEKPASLALAVSGATGVSDGSAHRVPALLLPDEIQGRRVTDMTGANMVQEANVEMIDCFRIDGSFAGNPTTLWIHKKTFLVRRTVEHHHFADSRTETTTTYDAAINQDIPDQQLELHGPGGPDTPAPAPGTPAAKEAPAFRAIPGGSTHLVIYNIADLTAGVEGEAVRIADLIRESWKGRDDRLAAVAARPNQLIVRAPRSLHREIPGLLSFLRQPLQVELEYQIIEPAHDPHLLRDEERYRFLLEGKELKDDRPATLIDAFGPHRHVLHWSSVVIRKGQEATLADGTELALIDGERSRLPMLKASVVTADRAKAAIEINAEPDPHEGWSPRRRVVLSPGTIHAWDCPGTRRHILLLRCRIMEQEMRAVAPAP